jgi:hypothetical protein
MLSSPEVLAALPRSHICVEAGSARALQVVIGNLKARGFQSLAERRET